LAHPTGIPSWLPPAAIAVFAAPTLFLAYLPMTDLPQHLAVASILLHFGDPGFGFDEFYEPAIGRTLYLLPCFLAVGLAQIMPLAFAMRVVVFLSAVAYPIGVFAVLRATGKSGALALLALPLMYNRAFFWGFFNFNLALGMSLAAFALLIRPQRSARSDVALAVLCTAIVFTHVYGIALVLGLVCVWLAIGERRALLMRALPLAPLAIGATVWWLLGRHAEGSGKHSFEPLLSRWLWFDDAILGGYPNWSDEILLWALLLVVIVFWARTIPRNADRWRATSHGERILVLFAALNFALYWVLPTDAQKALVIHFRHGLIAVAFLPMLVSDRVLRDSPRAGLALLGTLTALGFAVHWTHLVQFDREARPFERVIEQIPDTPKIYFLDWGYSDSVVQTRPYHHFHAYIQAKRGGLTSFGFPNRFWNIPVRMRDDAGIPEVAHDVEWHPELFDYDDVGYFYDFVLVCRGPHDEGGVHTLPSFPYELVYEDPPWSLYRRPGSADRD
jgi:hypothetical protein